MEDDSNREKSLLNIVVILRIIKALQTTLVSCQGKRWANLNEYI